MEMAETSDAANLALNPAEDSLAARVRGPLALRHRLASVYCVRDVAHAIDRLSGLKAHESVITPQGEWLGHGWARISRADSDHGGALQREQELRQMRDQLTQAEQQVKESESQLQSQRDALLEAEESLEQVRAHYQESRRRQGQLGVMVEASQRRLNDVAQREERLSEEIESIEAVSYTHLTLPTR